MKTRLSQLQIGQRIAELRKMKGLSQENLAKSVKISRPSLTQIELGNRCIDIIELQKMSQILGFSLDDFMSNDFSMSLVLSVKEGKKSEKIVERDSFPILCVDKFKNILLYILERCAGKPNIGESVLYKLLYFSDFNYYELYEESLTGATYRKLSIGPVPNKIDTIIHQMIETHLLKRIKTDFNGNLQTRYIPLVKADLTQMMASEKEVIDRVIELMSDWSTTAISSYAQKDMPCLASKEGEEINYELAFYREVPFTVRNYSD